MKRSTVRRARSSSSRDSPTIRPARVVARPPISLRSWVITWVRSASSWASAGGLDPSRLGLRLLPQLGQDLGALGLGVLADPGGLGPGLGQLGLVLLHAASAASCAFSAFSMPPWMAAVRSA